MIDILCDVCNKNKAVGVFCVPGVPMSCAYCQECIDADAHPWGIVVANTACVGGMEYAADWWKELVEHTCNHLGKTIDEFNKTVEEELKTIDNDFSKILL